MQVVARQACGSDTRACDQGGLLQGAWPFAYLAFAAMSGTVRCFPFADAGRCFPCAEVGRALRAAARALSDPAHPALPALCARCAPIRSCRRESSSGGRTLAAMAAAHPGGRIEEPIEAPPASPLAVWTRKALRTARERPAVESVGPLRTTTAPLLKSHGAAACAGQGKGRARA